MIPALLIVLLLAAPKPVPAAAAPDESGDVKKAKDLHGAPQFGWEHIE